MPPRRGTRAALSKFRIAPTINAAIFLGEGTRMTLAGTDFLNGGQGHTHGHGQTQRAGCGGISGLQSKAALLVADKTTSLVITGVGDVLEPDQGLMAIGSGGDYAKSAAKALLMQGYWQMALI